MKNVLLSLFLFLCSCKNDNFDVVANFNTKPKILKISNKQISNSRQATVKVIAFSEWGQSVGTGTIYQKNGKAFMITAAHVFGPEPGIFYIDTGYEKMLGKIVYLNQKLDIAIVSLPGIGSVNPIPFDTTPLKSIRIGDEILYSGFPNNEGIMTIKGYISGVSHKGDIYLHSYAWPGASGSSVFDSKGRLLGILIAVSVGSDYLGEPTIIEDIVLIVPINLIEIDKIINSL